MTTETLHDEPDLIVLEPGKILPQPLADVGTDERLIAGEPQHGREALEILDHILRDTDADRGHGAILAESLLDALRHLHTPSSRRLWLGEPRRCEWCP